MQSARAETEVHTGAIAPLLAEWKDLFSQDHSATPFMSAEWAHAWWPHWADGAEPWIVTVRDRGSLVGLAPMVLRRRGPFRTLVELGRQPGNYWDILAVPERRSEVTAAVLAQVVRSSHDWDALVLGALEPGSLTTAALRNSELRVQTRPPTPYPAMVLPDTFDEYLGRFSRSTRKNLRKHLRRVDDGPLEVERVTDPGELPELAARWRELRVNWWRARGRSINPEHAAPRTRAFMADVLPLLVRSGLAEVDRWHMDRRLVGVHICLADQRRTYTWMDGWDPSAEALGIGKVAALLKIRSSVQRGCELFDFMVGAEPYKHQLGAENRACDWIMLSGDSPRSRAALLTARVRGFRKSRVP